MPGEAPRAWSARSITCAARSGACPAWSSTGQPGARARSTRLLSVVIHHHRPRAQTCSAWSFAGFVQEFRIVNEKGDLDPVVDPSLLRMAETWVFTVDTLRWSSALISAFDRPWPTATATSRSRSLRHARRSIPRVRRRSSQEAATWAIRRRVTAGDRTGSPLATRRIAATISLGGVSFRTNPAAPARRARTTCSSASNVVRMMTSGASSRSRLSAVDHCRAT
jgi:hypothetical protein